MYRVARQALAGRAGRAGDAGKSDARATTSRYPRRARYRRRRSRAARDSLVEHATAAVGEAEAFVRQHDLISLPEGPVRVILMPEFQRGVAVAYCDFPGPLERNLETFYAISPIPDDWSEEQRRLVPPRIQQPRDPRHRRARGDAGPLRADLRTRTAIPRRCARCWARARSWKAGPCYAEEMMVQQGFRREDPLYRLSQLKVQLRTITNAIHRPGHPCRRHGPSRCDAPDDRNGVPGRA